MDYITDEGDLHVCGFCKQSFKRLDQWLEHKQLQWCKRSPYRLSRSISQQHEMVILPTTSSHDSKDLHRPYRLTPEEPSEPQDMSSVGSRIGADGLPAGIPASVPTNLAGPFSVPIKRSLYPIMPPNRKRERVRSRKQESPQPLIKLEKSSPTPSFSDSSIVPTSPVGEERDVAETTLYKRPRGRPRKESNLSVIVSPPGATSSPGLVTGSTGSVFSPDQSSADISLVSSHSRRPLVLPRVYSCPRCSKSFIKLSHLHRHMNKKKPCEAKETVETLEDNSESEDLVTLPSDVSFTCGLCSEHYNSYDDIINHHSEKHPAYYPGYCRFCGKFQDRKNKLLIHLIKHDHSQIVDEVAQEVKRIRHIKIDKPLPATQLSIPSSSGSTFNLGAGSASGSGTAANLVTPHIPLTPSSTPVDIVCPCCAVAFPDRDELICHFRDFHTPVGCHISDADIQDIFDEAVSSASTNHDGLEPLQCFVCCLRLRSQEAFDQHIDFHKVWSEKVEPSLVNGSPRSDQLVRVDENRNTSQTPNNETGAGDAHPNNNNSEHVMDLSIGSKKFDKASLMSVFSVDSNGSPEETVALDYPCWLCANQHSDLESLRDHIAGSHQVPLLFRCVVEECRQEFLSWTDLYEHRTEHSQRSFVCKVCNDHQPSRSQLANHSEAHNFSKNLPAICAYCQCLVQENMELHRIQCSQQLVGCPECNEKVKRFALMKHILGHSSLTGKSYQCEHCDSTFPLRDRLTQHIKNVHGPRKFVCTDCGAAFKRNDKLQRHCQSRHSDLKPYLCPIVSCGRAFKRIDGLRAHVRCSHVSEALAHLVKNHYGCTVCGKLVSGQEKLVDHLMSHVKATPPSVMSSSSSGELFGSPDLMDGGRGASTSTLPQFECPHCHIEVPNKALFYAHLVQHSQAAAFRSSVLPFVPGSFFFPLGQHATAPGSKTE